MPEKVRWGVLGCGGIARRRTIPEGIAPAGNGELRTVCDVDAGVSQEVAKQFGAAAAPGIDELLGSDIDAVYIATPPNLHAEQAAACARAGKHILCEKPLGMTVEQAEQIATEVHAAGVRFGTAFMMRFHAQHQAAMRLIEQGRLGKLVYGRAQLSCWYPPIPGAWRQDAALGGGGSLIDMGGHCIDLLEMFFGPVVKVSCFAGNLVHGYAPEDSAVAMLHFECRAYATVDTFFCIPDASSRNVLELYGSAGSVLAEGTIGQGSGGKMVAHLTREAGAYEARQEREAFGGVVLEPEPVNPYRAEIEAFGQAVLAGREPPVGLEAGVRSQRVLAACYESATTGVAVSV